jgi:hypothetical protein
MVTAAGSFRLPTWSPLQRSSQLSSVDLHFDEAAESDMMERIEVMHVPSLEPAIERSCEPPTLELHFAAFSIRFVTHTNTFTLAEALIGCFAPHAYAENISALPRPEPQARIF